MKKEERRGRTRRCPANFICVARFAGAVKGVHAITIGCAVCQAAIRIRRHIRTYGGDHCICAVGLELTFDAKTIFVLGIINPPYLEARGIYLVRINNEEEREKTK